MGKKGRETHAAFTCENTVFFQFEISCELGNTKMGREAQRLHFPVGTQCFVQLGISCELGNRKKHGTGDRQEAFTCERAMFCAVWNKIRSMQSDVSTTESGDQKM